MKPDLARESIDKFNEEISFAKFSTNLDLLTLNARPKRNNIKFFKTQNSNESNKRNLHKKKLLKVLPSLTPKKQKKDFLAS